MIEKYEGGVFNLFFPLFEMKHHYQEGFEVFLFGVFFCDFIGL